jgi:hypothetical protein
MRSTIYVGTIEFIEGKAWGPGESVLSPFHTCIFPNFYFLFLLVRGFSGNDPDY